MHLLFSEAEAAAVTYLAISQLFAKQETETIALDTLTLELVKQFEDVFVMLLSTAGEQLC